MGKKGKAEAEVVPDVPEEPPDEDDSIRPTPPVPSRVLTSLGWEVVPAPSSGRCYYYSVSRGEARMQPPYYQVLGLDESAFRTLQKADLWTAFYARRVEFKKQQKNGALSEELKDPKDEHDWKLIMEAFNVLIDIEARAEYEQRNLSPHAKEQLVGLRVNHEVRVRREPEDAVRAAELFLAPAPPPPAGAAPPVEGAGPSAAKLDSEADVLRRLSAVLCRQDPSAVSMHSRASEALGKVLENCSQLPVLDSLLREATPLSLVHVVRQLAKTLPTSLEVRSAFVRSGGLQFILELEAEEGSELQGAVGEVINLFPPECKAHLPRDPEGLIAKMSEVPPA